MPLLVAGLLFVPSREVGFGGLAVIADASIVLVPTRPSLPVHAVAAGLSNVAIAARLVLTERAVEKQDVAPISDDVAEEYP